MVLLRFHHFALLQERLQENGSAVLVSDTFPQSSLTAFYTIPLTGEFGNLTITNKA